MVPLHLLYTFDTTDPACPIQIPGIRDLPLYYCFPYNAGDLQYRVTAEDEIQILYMGTEGIEPDFPYPDYPSEFPEIPVSLVPVSYNEHKTLAYFIKCEEFYGGKENLGKEDRQWLEECGYPFTQLGGMHHMWQGVPEFPCRNPGCRNENHANAMEVFAVIWNRPAPGVFLWGDEDEMDVQIIYQMCPECHSIHVCNRCT